MYAEQLIIFYGSAVKHLVKEMNVKSKAQHERSHQETGEIYQEDWSLPWALENETN
jgi:hypothetical protein